MKIFTYTLLNANVPVIYIVVLDLIAVHYALRYSVGRAI
jgi:hypothetical protein